MERDNFRFIDESSAKRRGGKAAAPSVDMEAVEPAKEADEGTEGDMWRPYVEDEPF